APLTKNVTFLTSPLGASALALIVTGWFAWIAEPSIGLRIETVGGTRDVGVPPLMPRTATSVKIPVAMVGRWLETARPTYTVNGIALVDALTSVQFTPSDD